MCGRVGGCSWDRGEGGGNHLRVESAGAPLRAVPATLAAHGPAAPGVPHAVDRASLLVAGHLFPARRSHWGFTANGPPAFLCALVSRYLEVYCPNWLRVLCVLEF